MSGPAWMLEGREARSEEGRGKARGEVDEGGEEERGRIRCGDEGGG